MDLVFGVEGGLRFRLFSRVGFAKLVVCLGAVWVAFVAILASP